MAESIGQWDKLELYSLCDGLRQKPLPKKWGHISFSSSENSAAGDFAGNRIPFDGNGIPCTTTAAGEAEVMSAQEASDSAFFFLAARRFFLFLNARRQRHAGSFTMVRTRRFTRPHGQQQTTAAHSAAVPPATSATRLLGLAGSFKIKCCLLARFVTGAAVRDIGKGNHTVIF
ncbi:hypothetical protein IEQ34_015436 [Dendrobium chrysotoxum]|uniref:Uncharacterized protein n=1 Tax=Dendrobium chrysotoxum TaxID=161865 RepID=A0AAV7GIG0_DENCH|nr:hypothetical protein IEQ34_015436 [Dendrobium chrysotoxum]